MDRLIETRLSCNPIALEEYVEGKWPERLIHNSQSPPNEPNYGNSVHIHPAYSLYPPLKGTLEAAFMVARLQLMTVGLVIVYFQWSSQFEHWIKECLNNPIPWPMKSTLFLEGILRSALCRSRKDEGLMYFLIRNLEWEPVEWKEPGVIRCEELSEHELECEKPEYGEMEPEELPSEQLTFEDQSLERIDELSEPAYDSAYDSVYDEGLKSDGCKCDGCKSDGGESDKTMDSEQKECIPHTLTLALCPWTTSSYYEETYAKCMEETDTSEWDIANSTIFVPSDEVRLLMEVSHGCCPAVSEAFIDLSSFLSCNLYFEGGDAESYFQV
ncbi:hypothetical protein EAF04_007192 [Stromatinia cepivora]|nr:hypothetical protein EAF04_007192 [Stromatinia cepivora]